VSRLKRLLAHPAVKAAYLGLLLVAVGLYLYRSGGSLVDRLADLDWYWVCVALVSTFLAGFLYCLTQQVIYRRLGVRIGYWQTFRIVSLSALGKYVPGKVLFAGHFYVLSREAGIGNAQIGTGFALSMALWMLTASLCGLPAFSLLSPALRWSVVLMPVLLVIAIHPRILGWLIRQVQLRLGRAGGDSPPSLPGLTWGSYLVGALLYLGNWLLAGVGSWASLRALAPGVGLDAGPLALASVAVGTVAGFVALFAPVGLGVREGVGALILGPVVGGEVALLSLVLLRVITVLVDLALALLAVFLGRAVTGRID